MKYSSKDYWNKIANKEERQQLLKRALSENDIRIEKLSKLSWNGVERILSQSSFGMTQLGGFVKYKAENYTGDIQIKRFI